MSEEALSEALELVLADVRQLVRVNVQLGDHIHTVVELMQERYDEVKVSRDVVGDGTVSYHATRGR